MIKVKLKLQSRVRTAREQDQFDRNAVLVKRVYKDHLKSQLRSLDLAARDSARLVEQCWRQPVSF